MSQIRIASINIERSNHLHRVTKFLDWYQPDVLCLQELCARDIPLIEDLVGNAVTYAPMCLHPAEVELEPVGVGLVAWGAMQDIEVEYYDGAPDKLQPIGLKLIGTQNTADPATLNNMLITATYQGFRIGTTHLTVTHAGESTPYQRDAATRLIKLAQAQAARAGGLLLTGDFNAPRGRATFDLLAQAFTDGVPASYTTSIDGSLHCAGQLPYMVDGLFHTPTYKLQDATLHTGISDHCALTCTLTKA